MNLYGSTGASGFDGIGFDGSGFDTGASGADGETGSHGTKMKNRDSVIHLYYNFGF